MRRPLSFVLDTDNLVKFVAGDPLGAGACRQLLTSLESGPESAEAYAEAARCFLRENQSLYLGHDAGLDLSFLKSAGVFAGTEPGEVMVRLQHHHNGVKVTQGDIKAFFVDGTLLSVAGQLHDPRGFPSQAPLGEDVLLAGSRAMKGPELLSLGTSYDTERRAFVFVAQDASPRGKAPEQHVFDATTGQWLESRPAGHHAGEASKRFWTRNYTPANGYWYPSGMTQQVAPSSFTGPTSGLCRHVPNRAPGSGDYVTKSAYIWDGQPRTKSYVYQDVACGSEPFSSWAWPDYRFFITNASYYLNKAADVKNHGMSFFSYGHTKYPIELNVCDYNLGGAGIYDPATQTISFEQDQYPGEGLTDGAENLGVIVHEYGHYIHHTYGMEGTRELVEGWADQNMHRYAVHQRFVSGEWPAMDYSVWGNRHQQQLVDGEWRIDAPPQSGNDAGSEGNYYYPGVSCSPSSYDPYGCGSLLSIVYWELAFDRCRLAHGDCAENQQIVQSGPYYNQAWALANSAFAYAIWMATSTTDVRGFMSLVADRYAQFEATYDYLSLSDYARVLSVMEHHCLGPTERCSGGSHRLPGSPLPSSRSHKKLLTEAESRSSTLGSAFITNNPNGASADKHVTFNPGSRAQYTVQLPQAGTYRLKFLSNPGSGSTQLDVSAPDGRGWRRSTSCPRTGPWRWCDGPTIGPLGAGSHSIWIGPFTTNASGTYLLDAFVLEKL